MSSLIKTPLVLITENLATKYSASNPPPAATALKIHSIVDGTAASAYDLFTVPDPVNSVVNTGYVGTDKILVIKDTTTNGVAAQTFSNSFFDITRVINSGVTPPVPALSDGDQIVILNGNTPLSGGNLTVNDASSNGAGSTPIEIGVVAPGETVRFVFFGAGQSAGSYVSPAGWVRV